MKGSTGSRRRAWRHPPAALALPYLAVAVGWVGLGSAWAAILLYHGGMLALARLGPGWDVGALRRGGTPGQLGLLLAGVGVAGAAFLGAIDLFVRPELDAAAWLRGRGVSGPSAWGLAVYYAVVHPLLEELHFRPLRAVSGSARRLGVHVLFAGYHLLVIGPLLRPLWVLWTFVGLVGVSALWGHLDRETEGGRLSLGFHAAADLTVSVAWLRLAGLV